MSDGDRDGGLREMAANRGCKLVRSRRRKPGGDYGLYGLKDAETGAEIFGFGKAGLTATAGEIEAHLRGGAQATWKKAVIASGGTARRKTPKPSPPPKPDPVEPVLKIRDAKPADKGAIAGLIAELGYQASPAAAGQRLELLRKAGTPPLVAEEGRELLGCLTWHVTPMLHRPRAVGRITMLIVMEAARGRGIGKMLVEAVGARLAEKGCGLVEVTSNITRADAHAFYESLGFERTSHRFAKPLR